MSRKTNLPSSLAGDSRNDGSKAVALRAQKSAAEGSPEILAIINEKYSLIPLKPEDVYIRKIRLAHNAIDRDNDRFSEEILSDFARTLPGKSLLDTHQNEELENVIGRFVTAELMDEPLAKAIDFAGEDLRLPDGVKSVKWLVGDFYIPLISDRSREIAKSIDAGLYRHASIGYSSGGWKRVHDEEDVTLYFEIQPPGEAREGSLVWLGAQPGARATLKSASNNHEKEIVEMKSLLKMMGLSESASEDSALAAFKAVKGENEELRKTLDAAGVKTVAEAEELKSAATAGKAYKQSLAEKQATAEVALGRITDGDAKTARVKSLMSRSVDELKADVDFLEKAVKEKHPSKATTASPATSTTATGGKSFVEMVEEEMAASKLSFSAATAKTVQKHPDAYAAHMAQLPPAISQRRN